MGTAAKLGWEARISIIPNLGPQKVGKWSQNHCVVSVDFIMCGNGATFMSFLCLQKDGHLTLFLLLVS